MAKCKTNTKLYNDLLNDSSPQYRQRADFIFNLIMDTDFKSKFGDWSAIEGDPDTRLDEEGNPTVEALKDYFKSQPEELERVPKMLLSSGVGTENEQDPEVKEIENILTRISRRIRQLQRATKTNRSEQKTSEEAIRLLEEAEQTGDRTKLIKFNQNNLRQNYINELKVLQERLLNANEKVGFKEYFINAEKLLFDIKSALNVAGAVDIGILSEYQMKLKFFTGLEQINTVVRNNREINNYVKKDNDGGKAVNIDIILGEYNNVMNILNQRSVTALSNKWGQKPGVKTAAQRIKLDAFFLDNFQKQDDESSAEYTQRKNEYVNKTIADNTGFNEDGTPKSITAAEIAEVERLLTHDPQDMSQLYSYIMNPRNMHNGLIDIAVELLDQADYFSMRKTINKATQTNKLVEEFYAHIRTKGIRGKNGKIVTNTQNMEDVYYKMIAKDKDGNLTRNLTGKFLLEPYQIRKELSIAREQANEEGTVEEILKANENYNAYVSKNFNRGVPLSQWLNPEYSFFIDKKNQNDPEVKMYMHLISMGEEINDFYYKEDNGLPKIAAIEKEGLERIFESGVLQYLKKTMGDFYKVRGTDIDEHAINQEKEDEESLDEIKKWTETKAYVHAFLDENNKQEKHIPIYYRRGDLVSIEDQSFDLASVFMLDYYGGLNYFHKNSIKPELDLFQGAVANRKVEQNHFGKKFFDKVPIAKNYSKYVFSEIEGNESNTYKALLSLYDDRLYGQRSIGGTATVRKIFSSIGQYTGDVMLIANIKSSVASIMHSRSIQSITAMSGSVFGVDYTLKNVGFAEKTYWSNTPSILSDFGKIRPQSFVNLLGERFTAGQEWSPLAKKFMKATRLSRLADKSTLHGMHGASEHYVQHILMLSFLNAIKVRNKKGEYIDANNNKVKLRDSAVSVAEMYEVVDGKLELKKSLQVAELEFLAGNGRRVLKLSNMSMEEAEYKINSALQEINYYINGNYSYNDQSYARRHFIGKAVAGLRKFMVPGAMKRFRGLKTLSPLSQTPRDLKTQDDYFYSKQREDFVYGDYVETSRFLSDVIKNGEALKISLSTKRFNRLTDREKVAVVNTVGEFTSMVLALAGSMLLAAAAEDERDKGAKQRLYVGAFYTRRLFSELMFYINPVETYRIIKSPAASLSVVENGLELLFQLLPDIGNLVSGRRLETYKRGKRKGQSKLFKEFRDLIPLTGQVEFLFNDDKNFEDSFGYLTKSGVFQ